MEVWAKALITMLFIFHIKLFEQVIMKSYEKEPFYNRLCNIFQGV